MIDYTKNVNTNIYSVGYFHNLEGQEFLFGKKVMDAVQNCGNYNIATADDLNLTFEFIVDSIAKDSDGDGLLDDWEINGIDVDNDGMIDVSLNKMGADPNKPDVFVAIDWMCLPFSEVDVSFKKNQSELNYKPYEEALKIVYEQYKKHGINLHIDAGSDSIDYVTGNKWGELSESNPVKYSEIINIANDKKEWKDLIQSNFNFNRLSSFRYCIFVNKFDTGNNLFPSGISDNIPGQYFLISDVRSIEDSIIAQAGTFMHELGHTLGLSHGGIVNGINDYTQYKPNYLSIMNYYYQLKGLYNTKEVNYGEYSLNTLDENNLSERLGFDSESVTKDSGLGVIWGSENDVLNYIPNIAGQFVDFNGNGIVEDSIKYDLNNDGNYNVFLSTENDWNNLKYKGGLIGQGIHIANEKDIGLSNESNWVIESPLYELTPYTLHMKNILPDTLYTDFEQIIDIEIENFAPYPKKAKIKINCDLFGDIEENLDMKGNEVKIIKIPITPTKAGVYKVNYIFEYEDGHISDNMLLKEIPVENTPEEMYLYPGDEIDIRDNGDMIYESEDESILKIEGKHMTAISPGIVRIYATRDIGLKYIYYQVVRERPIENTSESVNNTLNETTITSNFIIKTEKQETNTINTIEQSASDSVKKEKTKDVETGDKNNNIFWILINKLNVARRTCGYIGTQFWNRATCSYTNKFLLIL